jgi:methylglutaconyl-CoA hydratase
MSYRYLQIDKSPGVIARISLNRPEKRNALNLEMMQELCEVFAELQADPQVRIVVLSGEGKVFCAGLDLAESIQLKNVKEMAESVSRVLTAIYFSELVTIAILEGDAIAGGGGLVAACDFAIAADDVRIGFPEVHRGMVAAVISALLCRKICQRDVRHLLLTGDLISSQQACDMRLITYVVSRGVIWNTVNELTDKILKGSPNALKESKKLLCKLAPTELSRDMRIALDVYDNIILLDDAKEGIAAFLEKRDPNWIDF